jgi:methylase of polypeptide subunit release factors
MKYEKVTEFYDKRYSTESVAREPIPLVKGLAERMHRGMVLEIGAGRGDNSLFLSGRGFDVLATDISPVAVALIQKRAKEEGISIQKRSETVLREEEVLAFWKRTRFLKSR